MCHNSKVISLNNKLNCILFTGSTTLQLTPVQSLTQLITPEVTDLVRLNGYFKMSSNSLDHTLNKVNHPEITMCALGGLINHLTRLMVCLIL